MWSLAWWKRRWRHTLAAASIGSGLIATVWLAVLGASEEPLARGTAGFLVVVAAGFQLVGGSLVHSIGKADPGLARAAVRRLLLQAKGAQEAVQLAESSYEQGDADELRRAMGLLSVHLSYLVEGAIESVEDWREFHEIALERLLEEGPLGRRAD